VIDRNGDFGRDVILFQANEYLGQTFHHLARHPGALDPYLPYRHHERLLEVAVERAAQSGGLGTTGQLRILRHLLEVQVPRLGTLEVKDLVAIRKQDAAFDSWRRALELALTRVDGIDTTMLGADEEVLREIRQELEHESRALHDEIKQSTFLSRLKREGMSMSVSGVVGLIAQAFPWSALAKLAGLGGQTLADRKQQQQKKSTLEHYLLFSPRAEHPSSPADQ
jgi:hypothetical protein